jgi:hypothetical protein
LVFTVPRNVRENARITHNQASIKVFWRRTTGLRQPHRDPVRRENPKKSAFLPTTTGFLRKPRFLRLRFGVRLLESVGIFSEFAGWWLKNASGSLTLSCLRKKDGSEAV